MLVFRNQGDAVANIVITGASRGIGLELARQYGDAGDRVYAYARSPESAEALNTLSAGSGGGVTVHRMDVGDGSSIETGARVLGDQPLDVLINNAGVVGGKVQSLQQIDFDDWIDAFKVMTIGPFRVVQAFLQNLKAAEHPKILTVTSQLAASTWPMGGFYAYASAKAGVNKVMQALALDLKGENIAVAMVHPGWVKTDMGGPNAQITPEESASGIRRVVEGLSPAETGRFYKWNGEGHSW
jgi:NAD(P)-dependent dehydrogenase (short-subunit alcohol dehydrogenase family)